MSTAIIVFAKAPEAGLAKTRLIPALGAEGAAKLAERLLHHTLKQVLTMTATNRELCVTPTLHHPAFEGVRKTSADRLQITLQGDGDLGERMHRALSRALTAHSKALLIGTDAPSLDTQRLEAACLALDRHEAVFVPALDGGYALVGLRRPAPALFDHMTWSTPRVMQDTRDRARAIGLTWVEMHPVADIDEPADLAHLPEDWR
jgi:rSAM/selenodomain-associated transferase 1